MKSQRFATVHILALAVLATAASAAPTTIAMQTLARATSPAAALREHSDPRLEQMRAGHVSETTSLTPDERSVLCAAQSQSAELLDMRAGADATGVLLILAVVLLIVLLI